ncbi:2-dehydropantoate 2-reductase [Aureobasidium pullulans]|nr:2-dehydropantoate 2-reductase [Aureobasidium pullulans]
MQSAVLSCPHKIATTYDYIICAHKAISPGLDPNDFRSVANMDTTFVILQNGVGNEEPFRNAFPYCSIVSCVIWVGATQDSPGVIRHTASEHTDIGLYPNPRLDATVEETRLEGFAAMLRAGGTPYTISDDIQVKRWEKVVWNDTQQWLSSSKESVSVTKRLMREVIGVARRSGVALEYGLVDILMERIQGMPGIESSMQVDAEGSTIACIPTVRDGTCELSEVMIQQTDGSMGWKQIIIWDTRSITDQSVEDSILSLSMLCQEEGRMRRGVLSILSFEPHKRAVLADGG